MKRLADRIQNIMKQPVATVFVVAWLAVFMEAFLSQLIMDNGERNVLWKIALSVGDACFIMIPYWVLGRRWRRTVIIPLLILPVFLLANIWNYRFFGKPIIGTGLLQIGSVRGVVVRSVGDLIRPIDFVIPLLSLTAIYVWFRFRKQVAGYRISRYWKTILSLSCFWIWLFPQTVDVIQTMKKRPDLAAVASKVNSRIFACRVILNQEQVLNDFGVVYLFYTDCLEDRKSLTMKRNLTQEEIDEVTGFLSDNSESAVPPAADFSQNSGKNLIYIIVESLDAGCYEYESEGHILMPNLRELAQEEGTVFTKEMRSQVSVGISSDGHLTTITGVLPLRKVPVSNTISASISFTSLPKQYPERPAYLFKGNESWVWNSNIYWRSFGFNNYYAEEDISPDAGLNEEVDEKLFDFALNKIKAENNRPFFATILTMSMHAPYTYGLPDIPEWIKSASDLTEEQRRFYSTANYFDRCLAKFIGDLKEAGLYDDSVIVIVSDHSLNMVDSRRKFSDNVVFLATNTGVTEHITRVSGQVDIYPTVREIMGFAADYNGLGHSILDPQLNSAVSLDGEVFGDSISPYVAQQRRAWDVSELILCGNYFGKYYKQSENEPE